MRWKSKINQYPYFLPSDCEDNRVELYTHFLEDFEIKKVSYCSSFEGYMGKFLNGDRSYNNTGKSIVFDKPPYNDHAIICKSQKSPIYVFHPYYINKEKLEDWCNKRDIIYCICDPHKSFYYPEHSYMVLLMSEQSYQYFNTLDVIMMYETENEYPPNGIYDYVQSISMKGEICQRMN